MCATGKRRAASVRAESRAPTLHEVASVDAVKHGASTLGMKPFTGPAVEVPKGILRIRQDIVQESYRDP